MLFFKWQIYMFENLPLDISVPIYIIILNYKTIYYNKALTSFLTRNSSTPPSRPLLQYRFLYGQNS